MSSDALAIVPAEPVTELTVASVIGELRDVLDKHMEAVDKFEDLKRALKAQQELNQRLMYRDSHVVATHKDQSAELAVLRSALANIKADRARLQIQEELDRQTVDKLSKENRQLRAAIQIVQPKRKRAKK